MGPLDRAIRRIKASAERARARATAGRRRVRARGQMLVLFVVSIFVLTGITAIVVDVTWYWANTLRVQRAADAAALAGVVWLPGAPGTAYTTAQDEADEERLHRWQRVGSPSIRSRTRPTTGACG